MPCWRVCPQRSPATGGRRAGSRPWTARCRWWPAGHSAGSVVGRFLTGVMGSSLEGEASSAEGRHSALRPRGAGTAGATSDGGRRRGGMVQFAQRLLPMVGVGPTGHGPCRGRVLRLGLGRPARCPAASPRTWSARRVRRAGHNCDEAAIPRLGSRRQIEGHGTWTSR